MTNYIMNGTNVKKEKIERWACDSCGVVVPAMTIYAKRNADDFKSKCPRCGKSMTLQEGEAKHVIKTKRYLKQMRRMRK